MTYRIEYDPRTEEHLRILSARDQATVLDMVPRQLADEPTVETRNRKRLRPNPLAGFRLRIGRLRVYYDVEEEPEPVVTIRAIGIKRRNHVLIGKEEIEL